MHVARSPGLGHRRTGDAQRLQCLVQAAALAGERTEQARILTLAEPDRVDPDPTTDRLVRIAQHVIGARSTYRPGAANHFPIASP